MIIRQIIYIFLTLPACFLLSCGNEETTAPEEYYFRISGRNLHEFTTILGDSVLMANNEDEVNLTDIKTSHFYEYSVLEANTKKRVIMADNVTRYSHDDVKSLHVQQKASFIFNLENIPAADNTDFNGQAIHLGLYIHDGSTSFKDYGVFVRWVINPLQADYGDIHSWDGTKWVKKNNIVPDSLEHQVTLTINKLKGTGTFTFDRVSATNVLSATLSNNTDKGIYAALQFEIMNMYPVDDEHITRVSARFKNWKWEWLL